MVFGRALAGQYDVADPVDDSDRRAVSDAHADRGSTWAADVAGPVSVSITALTVAGCVYTAGKIYRTGLLIQGKAATIGGDVAVGEKCVMPKR